DLIVTGVQTCALPISSAPAGIPWRRSPAHSPPAAARVRRRLLFDGHGRTRAAAGGLCAGDRLQGIPAGAEEWPERQDHGHLFRKIGRASCRETGANTE